MDQTFITQTTSHWVVKRLGLGTKYFMCSRCGFGYYSEVDELKDKCPYCKSIINENEIEYL